MPNTSSPCLLKGFVILRVRLYLHYTCADGCMLIISVQSPSRDPSMNPFDSDSNKHGENPFDSDSKSGNYHRKY